MNHRWQPRVSLYTKRLMIVVVAMLVVTLVGCISTVRKGEVTLKSLNKKTTKVSREKLKRSRRNRAEARVTYKEFARSSRNEGLRARAMERLADMEMETQEEKTIQGQERNDQLARAKGQPIDVFQSEEQTDDADYAAVAKQYEDILKKHPNPSKNESVLYQLARAYDLSGQSKKSLTILSRLVKEYPNSSRKEEIEFRRGELYFQLKSYAAAARSYKVIMQNDDSNYYERAIYKYGWCLFKQNRITQSLKSFYELLDVSFRGGVSYESMSRGKRNLLDDTFRIVSLIFSYKKARHR